MTRSLILPAQPNGYVLSQLPTWTPRSQGMSTLPNVTAWFNGLQETVSVSPDGAVRQWNSRIGRSALVKPSLYPLAGSPFFVQNAYWDRNAVRFTKSNKDVLQWTMQRAIGATTHTTILIADLKPQTVGNHFLVGDSTPDSGQHRLTLGKASDGTTTLSTAAGSGGSVGIIKDVGPLVNVGRPVLIISVVDGGFNAVKMKVNNQDVQAVSGNPTLAAADVFLGASGYPDSVLGAEMDVYDLILMQDDIFADGRQGHRDFILDYAYTVYGIL